MTNPTTGRRLLIVAETLRGGLGGVVHEQTEWFVDHGWSVHVASPLDDEVPPPGRAAHHPVAIPESARQAASMARAIRTLRRTIHRYPPTVVHCHGLRSFTIARLASLNRPYVTLHGTGKISSDPFGYGVARRAALAIAPLLAATAFDAEPEERRGWRFAAHASPRLASLDRIPFPEGSETPIFLWLGRLAEPKRPALFVEAISKASKVRPVCGLLVGDGPLATEVHDLIVRLGAPIEVIGHSEDVHALLARSRAVIVFSRFEALNFSVQEAMWAGRPVVASPLPGLRWLIGDAGLFADNVESATASVLALTDLDDASRLGAKAAAHIRANMTPGAPWPVTEAAYLARLDRSR